MRIVTLKKSADDAVVDESTIVVGEEKWTEVPSTRTRRAVAKVIVAERAVKGATVATAARTKQFGHNFKEASVDLKDGVKASAKHRRAIRQAKKAFWNEQISQRGL